MAFLINQLFGAIGYRNRPFQLIYILRAKERCASFGVDCFKTKRRVCVETDRRSSLHISTQGEMLKRIYKLYMVGDVSFTALILLTKIIIILHTI